LIIYSIVYAFFNQFSYFEVHINPAVILISIFPLLYGKWGCLGLGSGYMVVHFILNYSNNLSQLSFFYLFNSLVIVSLSYFVFKLFYAFNFDNKVPTLHLNDTSNLIKFILVNIIGNAFFLYLYICSYYLFDPEVIFNSDNLNNFLTDYFLILNLTFIFNTLFVLIVNLTNIKVYKIEKSSFLKHNKKIRHAIILFSITLIIQLLYNYLIGKLYVINCEYILFNMIIIIFLVILKPNGNHEQVKYNTSFSEVIICFVLLISIFYNITPYFWYVFDWILFGETFDLHDFIELYFGVYDVINWVLMLIFSSLLLYYIEKNFSKPLQSVSTLAIEYITNRFSQKEHNNPNNIESILNRLDYLSTNKYETKFLSVSIKNMIITIEKYIVDLKKITAKEEKIDAELNVASKIQMDTIPNEFPPFPNRLNDFDIFASYIPAKNVGGDFYDYFLIDDNHLVIVIGDVSGKGVPAALFMMMVKTLIKDQLKLGLKPSEVFIKINNELNENNNEGMFVTVWLGLLNINSGEMTYVNAGHPKPFLFNKSRNQYNILESKPDFVLGGMENMKYKSFKITINAGDRLYLFTDGITESINQNEEEFQIKRLANVLNENHALKIEDLIPKVSKVLHSFTKGVEQFDDETMLILEYRKKN
jgi:sigma-B regulation protein RsbU (phosphoserine phosphatase)